MSVRHHPAADVLPLMVGEEFDALIADIRDHGLREPITLHPDGSILDGRNRYRACHRLGVEPRTKVWQGQPGTEAAFVISMNLQRRHLDASQRAMLAAKLANLRVGRPAENRSIDPISITEAANLLAVSEPTVKRARAVLDHGTPEQIAAVEAGEVSVSAAAKAVATSKPKRKPQTRTEKLERKHAMQRERARYWNQLSEALDVLSGLPDPADILPAVPAHTGRTLSDKLPAAIKWLTAFQEKWSSHDRSAA
jgi:ParB-like chromosome segregation protein Spo0J